MAEIITAKGTGFFIEKVIRGARERIVLISPYLKVQKLYLDELKSAAKKGIPITILFREDEAKQEQLDALLAIDNIRLLCLPELHAKCYFNEHRFVLTSMNLHDHSERNNKELGIMLQQGVDEPLFNDAVDSAMSILATAEPKFISRPKQVSQRSIPKATKEQPKQPVLRASGPLPEKGHCIRCNKSVPCDPDAPLCYEDFNIWIRYEDPDFIEKHCHTCGKSAFVSMADPMCNTCTKEYAGALRDLLVQRKEKKEFARRSWRRI